MGILFFKRKNKTITMREKLTFVFVCTSIIALAVNLFMYFTINRTIEQIDKVYSSNVNLGELADSLTDVQNNMYSYLNTKSSTALEAYYVAEQSFNNLTNNLNSTVTDSQFKIMEKNIKNMSATYLSIANDTVKAKRGRNVEKYKKLYEEAESINQYINQYITSLNNMQFKYNFTNYNLLRDSLKYLEVISTIVLLSVIFFNVLMIVAATKRITGPLMKLAKTADLVSAGNFDIEVKEEATGDEVEILSKAFQKMVVSIRDYIERLKNSMEVENQMKERELMMENHLKDAQLKYLQAQINPHFLFNTLNAGVQLAMMEDAEKTSIYIENMAEFFRYNITKSNQDTTLNEEILLVDHYIYILNVRFSGEISYEKQIDETVLGVMVPSMIIQPIVENAFQYGVRDLDWEGKITLIIDQKEDRVFITVKDNGKGISQEAIDKIMAGESAVNDQISNSNGIGLGNVINRLRLYFGEEDIFEIRSDGINMGTQVTIKIPYIN